MRTTLRTVEEAIASGDRNKALEAMKNAEPALMRAARQGQVHRNTASRKVSRLTHRSPSSANDTAQAHAEPACLAVFLSSGWNVEPEWAFARLLNGSCGLLHDSHRVAVNRVYTCFYLFAVCLILAVPHPVWGRGYPEFSVTEMSCRERVYRQYPIEELELP